MRSTHPLSITLPHDMATMVKGKVASGEYATESEVIRDGLRALLARDAVFEHWLRTEAAASYDEFAADPASGIAVEDVMDRVRRAYQNRAAKPESR
jgi:putative addiction module CopG family antidote